MPTLHKKTDIAFFHTHVAPQAMAYAAEVLQSGWLSEGAKVRAFEHALAAQLGLRNPVAVNSGTSALHLALALAGVGPGDEVILPAQTFVSTGMVILMQGAVPIFADIDPLTGNLAPHALPSKITPRTKAIMPVHWGGYPCDMDAINALAAQYGIAIIEDAAHALGATFQGTPIGAVSRFSAFSFQAVKHLTTGDGGALCCLNETDAQGAFAHRWFGIDRAKSRPSPLGERLYDLHAVGYKYHMNDLAAAVGLGNLEDFSQRLARRQQRGAFYREQLAGVPGLQLLQCADDRTHAYWLFTVLVDRRDAFIRHLADHGIPSSVVHLRIDRNAVFGGARDDLPGQALFNERQVSLPLHEGLTDDDVQRILSTVRSGW